MVVDYVMIVTSSRSDPASVRRSQMYVILYDKRRVMVRPYAPHCQSGAKQSASGQSAPIFILDFSFDDQ